MTTLENILDLYQKYGDELKSVWDRVVGSHSLFKSGSDDIEMEISYMLMREYKPQSVLEFSPNCGYTSTWILNALKANGSGKLLSYDIIDDALSFVPEDLRDAWTFHKQDIREAVLPDGIDYLFIDSDHSYDFAVWYVDRILNRYCNVPVSIHDIYHDDRPHTHHEEREVIMRYLMEHGIEYFSPSPFYNKAYFNCISSVRGVSPKFNPSNSNPTVYFRTPG